MPMGAIHVRKLISSDIPECERILFSLPDWFGLAESNREYIESLHTLPAAVAGINGNVAGFLAVSEHTPDSYEIHVMAVEKSHHRNGLGKALLGWAESFCVEQGVSWLHLKTRGPSTPDPGYNRTRLFYLDQGFEPLFESLVLWGPQDAALVMVKHLRCNAQEHSNSPITSICRKPRRRS